MGLYDGSVCVYDVRNKDRKPIYVSTSPKLKHTDPVWQVYWSREATGEEKPLSFYSISSDGRVSSWILNKSELLHEDVTEIKLIKQDAGEESEGMLCYVKRLLRVRVSVTHKLNRKTHMFCVALQNRAKTWSALLVLAVSISTKRTSI